jgi:hypothetical protein
MKKLFSIIFLALFALTGCKKDDNPKLSGTDTINNTLYGTGPYYAMGFSIYDARNVSTSDNPPDIITILADNDINYNVRKIYLATSNYFNSFYLFGKYADSQSAIQAFKNLTSFTDPDWTEIGDSVKANQVWLFRTSISTYVKLRTVSTVGETRNNKPYAECTFEWVYQPDRSLTFPGK